MKRYTCAVEHGLWLCRVRVDVEKLEEILKAEEASRHAVAAAHERAEARIRAAESEARTILDEGRTSAANLAASSRAALIATAREQGNAILVERATRLEVEQATARELLTVAVDAALGELAE